MSKLGVHLEPGVAWLALARQDGTLDEAGTDRVVLPGAVESPERALAEFVETFVDLIRRAQPNEVVLLDAGAGANPPPAAASRKRGQMEGAIMLAAYTTSTPLRHVTHNEVKTKFGHRLSDAALISDLAPRIAGEAPARWSARVRAFAAAVAALEGPDDA